MSRLLTLLMMLATSSFAAEGILKNAPEKDPGPIVDSTGIASYYAAKYHGRITASGEIYDMHRHTAAHRTLPFGTEVKVINIENHRAVVVRVNDRGPFIEGRVIDLSWEAAHSIGMVERGLVQVRLEIQCPAQPDMRRNR